MKEEVEVSDENSESDEVMGYSENNLQSLLNVLNKLRQERESFDEKRSVEEKEWIKANQFKQWPHFDEASADSTEKTNDL